jgi:PAS domain S-box-containing protein
LHDIKRLAERSQDAIYQFSSAVGQFIFYNQRFEYFFNLSATPKEPITDRMVFDTIHPEDRQMVKKSLKNALETGSEKGEFEYRVVNRDGSIRWLHDRWIVVYDDSTNQAKAIEGFIRDNTQRKIAELQFIQSKQNALIGSYIVQDGRFKYVNPEFLRITGYRLEELLDTESLRLVQEDFRRFVHQNAIAMLKGHNSTPYEFCVLDKSGDKHWILETVAPVSYDGRRATLGYFMDITKQRKIQGNLSALGLMIGTISHSLRGCLTGLDASLYLIETGFYRDKPARIEEGLDVTKLMIDRISKMVRDILYYVKDRELEFDVQDIWQFAKDLAMSIENRIKAANIDFHTDFPEDLGTFAIDSQVLRAAMLNLLENAMEACIEDQRPIGHRIVLTARGTANQVIFEFIDNGPGIAEEQFNKIFQLFYSSKGNKGTGIGLFITRKVIQQHHGSITAENMPVGGAKFRVTLPRQQP